MKKESSNLNIETEFSVAPQTSELFVEVAMEIEERAKRLANMTGKTPQEILNLVIGVLDLEKKGKKNVSRNTIKMRRMPVRKRGENDV